MHASFLGWTMLWWSLSGETLDRGGLEIYPYSFSPYEASPIDILLHFGLFRTYIHEKQRLGALYHEIGSDRPVAGVYTYRSWISASVNNSWWFKRPVAQDLYIFHVPTLGHTYTHMLGTHACKFSRVDDAPVVFIWRNPIPGGSEIYPCSFLCTRPHRWIFCFILVCLVSIYIESKGWAHFTMK
jgi:hypothetical protein